MTATAAPRAAAVLSDPDPVSVLPVASASLRDAFIRVPWAVYADDPCWIPPLAANERKRIGAFDREDRSLWVALRNGQPVGRISAQLSAEPGVGRFGWLECIDSAPVFDGLFHAAEGWLRERGVEQVSGPFNFSINEECGLLVDGFDTAPKVMMPHGRPHYAAQMERRGYAKAMDLLAYRIDPRASLPPRIEKLAALARADPAIVLRRPDYSRFEQEIGTVLDLFNDAWAGNWGFEPFTPAHIREMAHELKPILPPQAVCIAERDGRPVAFALGLPDINEMIRDLGGRLLPFGWAKLLFRLRTGRFHGGRLLLMGVRKEFQTQPLGAALAVAVIDRLRSECLRHRVHDVELSWVLETNRGVRSLLEAFGAEVYKRYRLYSRQIAQTVETRFGPEQ